MALLPDVSVRTFVLRIWLEDTCDDAGQAPWRGHITDLATGERKYVQDVSAIVAYLTSRLAREED